MGGLYFTVAFYLVILAHSKASGSGPTKCYFCGHTHNCQDPNLIQERNCSEDNLDVVCYSTKFLPDNVEFKGCASPNDHVFTKLCKETNEYPGASCRVCNTDLCNLN